MKRIFLVAVVFAIGIVLTGCQSSKKSSNIDDAEGALIQESAVSNIAAPPVPPVPTRPPK